MTTESFDERAATWDDDPAKVQRATLTADTIRSTLPLDGSERFLEYGAGTGLLSQALQTDVGSLVLAEVSAGMREVIQSKRESGTLPVDTEIWDFDLTARALPDDRFDLIATVMTLHHVVDTERLLGAFAGLLRRGGHVCIVDLDAEDGSFHGPGFEGHSGFDRDVLGQQLRNAGFEEIHFHPLLEVERPTGSYPVFFAAARRADTG